MDLLGDNHSAEVVGLSYDSCRAHIQISLVFHDLQILARIVFNLAKRLFRIADR